eukprot:5749254-Pleurochrysis_carterae.AAC.1
MHAGDRDTHRGSSQKLMRPRRGARTLLACLPQALVDNRLCEGVLACPRAVHVPHEDGVATANLRRSADSVLPAWPK